MCLMIIDFIFNDKILKMSYGYHEPTIDERLELKYENHPEHDRFTKLCNDGIKYGKKHGIVFGITGDQKEIIDFFGKKYDEFDDVEHDAYKYIEYNLEYFFEVICRTY